VFSESFCVTISAAVVATLAQTSTGIPADTGVWLEKAGFMGAFALVLHFLLGVFSKAQDKQTTAIEKLSEEIAKLGQRLDK